MTQVSSHARVKRHRDKLGQRGLRPIQIWVPDTSAPGFAEKARLQCQAINAAEKAANTINWVEAVSAFDDDQEPNEAAR